MKNTSTGMLNTLKDARQQMQYIKDIDIQISKTLTRRFYGDHYFSSPGKRFVDPGIEVLYTMFNNEVSRCNDYNILAKTPLEKHWKIHRPNYPFQSQERHFCIYSGKSYADIRPGGIPRQAIQHIFREFASENTKGELESFKISFKKWYQTFVLDVIDYVQQLPEYVGFPSGRMKMLASRIWNVYCDYIDYRESDELKHSIKNVQKLLDERAALVLEWRKWQQRDQKVLFKLLCKDISIFVLYVLAWAALFMYFTNTFYLILHVLFGLCSWGFIFESLGLGDGPTNRHNDSYGRGWSCYHMCYGSDQQ
jgi:hypothetical protein